MVNEKMLRLARALGARTEAGHVAWESTGSRDTFITTFGGYAVGIRKSGDDYFLDLLEDDGTIMDSASDVDLRATPNGSDAPQVLSSLHQLARRDAYGVDTALDSILSELGEA